ncbi:Dynein heavy chain 12, axonemal [Cladochytrium tenue]|nr:Dynein heavy chain 12, axonemal [Cladochytrium tenue]
MAVATTLAGLAEKQSVLYLNDDIRALTLKKEKLERDDLLDGLHRRTDIVLQLDDTLHNLAGDVQPASSPASAPSQRRTADCVAVWIVAARGTGNPVFRLVLDSRHGAAEADLFVGSTCIRLGDAVIENANSFHLCIITKPRNPHYLSELSVKGFKDQLLGIVVAKERPELEEEKTQLILQSAENNKKLKEIEDQILQILSLAEGNTLENETAIEVLSSSKILSVELFEKQKVAEETERKIDETRDSYRPIASHSSVLFFCIADLVNVESMYQYSLNWCIDLFVAGIAQSTKSSVLKPASVHKDFRLWLTSYPSDRLSSSILQHGVKMTNEPPKGIKANLLKNFVSDPVADVKFFGGCSKPLEKDKTLAGPLGWSIPYEFNDSDLRISIRQLQMFLDEYAEIPFKAHVYLTGNYGGRVTDDWDRRTLMNILSTFYCPAVVEENNYQFSPSGIYFVPSKGKYQDYLAYIKQLPLNQEPKVFDIQDNGDLQSSLPTPRNTQEQSVTSGGGGTKASDVIVVEVATDILARIPNTFSIEAD